MCSGLNMLSPESSTIRRCGLGWSRCVTVGMDFETLFLAAWKNVVFWAIPIKM
ncbi:mCG147708 [Mus musculus]|nr:mCG147708 [Mus musculus]